MVEQDLAAGVPVDDPEHRLDALLDAAQVQLREVVRQATAAAREDLAAAAAAVAAREAEIAALQAGMTAERAHLVADREALELRAAEIGEREGAVELAAAEVAELRERATLGLASALERSARLVEEAEAQAEERAARARIEADATLQRAGDRARDIVATAAAQAARSKAELRRLVAQIEGYVEREQLQIELDGDVPHVAEPPVEASHVAETPPVEESAVPGEWPAAAFAPVLVPSGGPDHVAATDGPGPDRSVDVSAEHRVADAVRRAVRGWSAARQDAE